MTRSPAGNSTTPSASGPATGGRAAQDAGHDTGKVLLALIAALVAELHPHKRGGPSPSLDHALDTDLGLDSLGRVELLFRIEQGFGVALADQVLASAETPRDLLRAIEAGRAAGAEGVSRTGALPVLDSTVLGAVEATPEEATNLLEVLDWHVAAHPDRPYVTFLEEEDGAPMTYGALHEEARRVAAGLQALELDPGQAVAIMLPTGRDYFLAFYGVLLAGGVPAPIYPPFRPSQLEEHLRRHVAILANAEAPILITLPEGRPVVRRLRAQAERLREVVTVGDLAGRGGAYARPVVRPGDLALLQYTSGSTGNPKGVMLTHANLLANLRAMGRALEVTAEDVFVSWLPLYHDMGLIGACLGTLYYAVPLALMSPLAFMARPERWLWAIHHHRGTLTAGVNFAYELCLRKIGERQVEGLDLSSLRLALNGAEPISAETLERFIERFTPRGLRPDAVAPVFGLAESSVGLTFPPLGRPPVIDAVRREPFFRSGRAAPAEGVEREPLRFVGCGHPLPGHQVRVVDDHGREVGERQVGRLQFKGPSTTAGYLRNPEATRGLFDGEWVDSGDLAYTAEGDIFPTGRVKDVIIRAGRNLHPHELEEAVGNLPGARPGCVVAFGSTDPRAGTERLVVVAESRERDPAAREALVERIATMTQELVGAAADDVVLAPAHSVLKTSSGKLRRAAVKELYETGRLGAGPRLRWRERWEVAASAVAPRLRRTGRRAGEVAYGLYAYTVLVAVALPAWSLIAVLPRPALAWPVARLAARIILRGAGIPVRVRGPEHLPRNGPCVVAANHSSYLDVLVLAAALPRDLAYVAKSELKTSFISRIFLRRLGCEYAERFDPEQGAADARRIAARARSGDALAFFPEGTFTRVAGLRPFHLGAFVAAVEGHAPIVPVALRGTRNLLREYQALPRRTAVTVQVCAPIAPAGEGWGAAIRLRDATRAELLRCCGEPDLAAGE